MSIKGFTLLEVMVALFIFALTGSAIVKTTAEHINSVGQLEEMTFATWVANNQLMRATILAQKQWPPKNNQKGQVEMADRQWYWHLEVANTDAEAIKQITVSVGLDADSDTQITSVTSFLGKPEQ